MRRAAVFTFNYERDITRPYEKFTFFCVGWIDHDH